MFPLAQTYSPPLTQLRYLTNHSSVLPIYYLIFVCGRPRTALSDDLSLWCDWTVVRLAFNVYLELAPMAVFKTLFGLINCSFTKYVLTISAGSAALF